MGSPRIERLQERYWRGKTSPAEEEELRRISKDAGNEDGEPFRPVCDYIGLVSQEVDTSFNLDFLDESIKRKKNSHWEQTRRNFLRNWGLGLAASVVIAICSVNYQWVQQSGLSAQSRSVENAYRETIAALNTLATSLDEGNRSILELRHFNETTKSVIHESH